MSDWKRIEDNDPKHCLKNRQPVDLYLQKYDITGEGGFRLTDCYYDAELDLFLTENHQIVERAYEHIILYFKPIELPR